MKFLLFPLFFCLVSFWGHAQVAGCPLLSITPVSAEPGDTVCLDIYFERVDSLEILIYEHFWDTAMLEYIKVEISEANPLNLNPSSISSIFLLNSDAGRLGVNWLAFINNNFELARLSEKTLLYSLCFRVNAPIANSTFVTFESNGGPLTVVGKNLDSGITAVHGKISNSGQDHPILTESCLASSRKACSPDEAVGQIDLGVSGGLAPYFFNWQGPDGFFTSRDTLRGLSSGTYHLTISDRGNNECRARIDLRTAVAPRVNISNAKVFNADCGTDNGYIALELTPEPGASPYEILWSNGATNDTLSGLAPGTYTISITDLENGCESSASYQIEENAFGYEARSGCTRGDNNRTVYVLTADSYGEEPTLYEWSNGEKVLSSTGSEIRVFAAGTYQLTLTDDTGCSQIETLEVAPCSFDTIPMPNERTPVCSRIELTTEVAPEDDLVCFDVIPFDMGTTSKIQYTHRWDSNYLRFQSIISDGQINDLSLADFTFELSPDLLPLSWQRENAPIILQDSIPIYSICFHVIDTITEPVLVEIIDQPTPMDWRDENGTPIFFSAISGVLKDPADNRAHPQIANSCILPPPICGAVDTFLNISVEVTGGSPGYAYQWSPPYDEFFIGDPNSVALPPGDYAFRYTVSDIQNRIITASMSMVEQQDQLDFDAFIVDVVDADCNANNGTARVETVNGSGNYLFTWSHGPGTAQVNNLAPGEYTVTITDSDLDCSILRSVTIQEEELTYDTDIVCGATIGDPVRVTATVISDEMATFDWSTGASFTGTQSSEISVGVSENHSVTITSPGGCRAIETFNTFFCSQDTLPPPEFYFANDTAQGCLPLQIDLRVRNFTKIAGILTSSVLWDQSKMQLDSMIAPTEELREKLQLRIDQTNGRGWIELPPPPERGMGGISVPDDSILVSLYFYPIETGDPNVRLAIDAIFRENWKLLEATTNNGQILLLPAEGPAATALEVMIDSTIIGITGENCLPLRFNGYERLAEWQFSLEWDSSRLVFDSLRYSNQNPSILDGAVVITFPSFQNLLNLDWRDENGLTLPDSTVFVDLCFHGKRRGKDHLFLSESLLPPSAQNVCGQPVSIVGARTKLVIDDRRFVWPGDTNLDNVVDHRDLLPIGLGFGRSGKERTEPGNIDWAPQIADLWPDSLPGSGINLRHVDCDGNGQVNVADTFAIHQNWGRMTPLTPFLPPAVVDLRSNQLQISIQSDTLTGGQPTTLDVILTGDADQLATAYGAAFSLKYEGLTLSDVEVTFLDSWLGTLHQDLLAVSRHLPDSNRIDISLTRLNQQDTTGSGPICRVHFLPGEVFSNTGQFTFEDITLINAAGEPLPITATTHEYVLVDQSTSTQANRSMAAIKIFPNPATDQLFVDLSQLRSTARTFQVVDVLGRLAHRGELTLNGSNTLIDVRQLEPGVYHLSLLDRSGEVVGLARFVTDRW